VLAPTTQTLELGAGGTPAIYDGNNSALIYGPAPLRLSGPATGFFANTYNWASNAGAVIQVEIEANSATVYWYRSTGSSSNINFCMVLEGQAGNELQCNNFSLQNSVADTDAPITLYGFGFGEHELIFENRTPGGVMSLDAIELR
jgi:hypothetical protein